MTIRLSGQIFEELVKMRMSYQDKHSLWFCDYE